LHESDSMRLPEREEGKARPSDRGRDAMRDTPEVDGLRQWFDRGLTGNIQPMSPPCFTSISEA